MSKKGKKTDQVLLIPGAEGWDVWTGSEELSLLKASGERDALSVDGVPGNNLVMAFPVRDVSAVPFLAATAEPGMFRDLAELHLERSGLRAEDSAGSLSDCFTIKTGEEEAVLLPVVLSPPPEGGLPKKSPKGFDVSARCFPFPASTVVLWREFGRWVFAVANSESKVVYFQALPGAQFDAQLSREVALGRVQLGMQEVLAQPLSGCQVWTAEGEIAPSQEALETLGQVLGLPVSNQPKPNPALPKELSKLLPADIRAERLAVRQAMQTRLAIAAGVIAYLGVVGFMGFKYLKAKEASEIATRRASDGSPAAQEVADFRTKWAELQPIVENQYWPIEQYFNVYKAAPKQGLRFTRIEMRNEFQLRDGEGQVIKRDMVIEGNSDQAAEAFQFGENLKRSSYFDDFRWGINSPQQTKGDLWRFEYAASFGEDTTI